MRVIFEEKKTTDKMNLSLSCLVTFITIVINSGNRRRPCINAHLPVPLLVFETSKRLLVVLRANKKSSPASLPKIKIKGGVNRGGVLFSEQNSAKPEMNESQKKFATTNISIFPPPIFPLVLRIFEAE